VSEDGTGSEDGDARDRALLAAHLDGDPDAFAALVGRHRDRLWAVAVRTLSGDREEAADALQDALLSAYRAAGQFRGEARVTTWLHRVVVNACLDRLRRRAARPTVPLPSEGHEPPAPDAVGDRETALDVAAALRALPVDQRAALVLVDLQGLPVEEAARALGVPVGTVKSRCSRGRARLAVSLGHLRNRTAAPPVPPVSGPGPELHGGGA
jgi:RNA polymerase sigma-70 factor, ECF subfamily